MGKFDSDRDMLLWIESYLTKKIVDRNATPAMRNIHTRLVKYLNRRTNRHGEPLESSR